ncbi:MAG TPA: tetratricopeptide repeat protein [Candidatus Limnocylindria bacterium]|nr:tetratricopeptide repeat protein [Candidatus Limnocylindria bacterium]
MERAIPGHKPWGLLAYVLLAPAPPARRDLSELLWPEADDPLAALRWALLQVRRALEPEVTLAGTERLTLGGELSLDVRRILSGAAEADEVEDLARGDLLEGLFFGDAPAFEHWLALERQRVGSASRDALLWTATLHARSDPPRALRLLERLLATDPTNDPAHELAVDIYVARGDRAAARRYIDSVERTYRAELGTAAPETVRRPLERPTPSAGARVPPSVSAKALLDVATARLDAGDYVAAEDAARRATSEAAASGERPLEARALVTLGGVLVHSVRGRDREAVGLLGRALRLAAELADHALASQAAREIGYVAFLAADYGAAETSLRRAASLADLAKDRSQKAQALTYLGATLIDRGDLPAAERTLREALAILDELGERRFRSFTSSFLARALIRGGRAAEGERMASDAVDAARAAGWHAVVPWILVHVGEAALAQGRTADAARVFGEAFTLASEMADPCWEGLSLRGLARVEARLGKQARARELLAEAHERCTRVPDTLWWADAAILTDLVELEGGRDRDRVEAALRLVRRGPMPDLADRLFPYDRRQTVRQTPG